MATETASMPTNGSFASHQGQPFPSAEQSLAAHSNNSTGPPGYVGPLTSSTSNNAGDAVQDISKEEVGWYFVERYYTTLSKKPDNLYLFYNKRSQSVFGVEDEKAPVCVGQRAINDRMKELDFQDCKIRVTNVDSQESGSDIVIQVIGEISNKSAPHRKFVQTFVLARQTNGYFVLNDIFRYIAEEEDIIDQEESTTNAPASTAEHAEPKTLTSSSRVAEQERDAHIVDEELDKVIEEQQEKKGEALSVPQVNGTSASGAHHVVEADEAPVAAVGGPEADTDADLQPEKPKDPEPSPTPAAAAPVAAPKTAAAPPKPAAPKTWASLAASANRSTGPPAAASQATPSQPQQKPTSQAPVPSSTAPATQPTPPPTRESPDNDGQQSDGWQAVGSGHDRKQSRAQGQSGTETPRFRAYIKNVYPSIDGDALKAQLTKFGELSYFDISRQKNCAFVDFATQAGFQSAVSANPHQIGSDQIFVEERRERPYQFQTRGGIRGGRGGPDNRTSQGRGGFGKENTRGGFQPRGRGGSVTPRGRGTGQAA